MKWKHIWFTVIVVAVCATVLYVSYWRSQRIFHSFTAYDTFADSVAISQLRWLDSANVDSDLRKSISVHDLHFLGVFGYTEYIPGVRRSDDSLLHIAGVRFADSTRIAIAGVRYIQGTSDALLSEEYSRLNHRAIAYATEYNRLLLKHLRQQKLP